MKTEYKRDLKNNYLVIEAEQESDMEDYMVHMTEQNVIPGLLPMQMRKMDGSCYLYYEINSCQSMESMYEKRTLSCQDIICILSEIQEVLDSVRRYLLNPRQILFDPRYMFINSENSRILFCYYPGVQSSLSVSLLAEYILKKLDHQDTKAVSLGYHFYQRAASENFSLSETLHEMLEKDWKEKKGIDNSRDIQQSRDTEDKRWAEEKYSAQENLRQWEDEFCNTEYKEETLRDRKNGGGEYESEVYHMTRKKQSIWLFRLIHPAILIGTLLGAVMTEILYYYGWISMTEAGGLFFLFLAAAILLNRFWKMHKEKNGKENEGRYQNQSAGSWNSKYHDAEQQETWTENPYKNNMESRKSYSGNKKADFSEDRTQLLSDINIQDPEIILESEDPGRYPTIRLQKKILIVGKTKGQADIILEGAAISRIHARLERRQGSCLIRDMNSKNGTYVNGVRLSPQEEKELQEGDYVMFADARYQVKKYPEDSDRTELLS